MDFFGRYFFSFNKALIGFFVFFFSSDRIRRATLSQRDHLFANQFGEFGNWAIPVRNEKYNGFDQGVWGALELKDTVV